MAVAVDLVAARALMSGSLDDAEARERQGECLQVDAGIANSIDAILASATGAYRQALVGTLLVKILAPTADLASPSVEHGDFSYSGRAIDESVVMPLFTERRIPVSQSSAYLSVLRRGKRFIDADTTGVRDRVTYTELNRVVAWLQDSDQNEARRTLAALLQGFLRLRDARSIALIEVRKLSLLQLADLTRKLLAVPSGGRIPMMLTLAALKALDGSLDLRWAIEAQGINAADSSSGSVGDITVRKDEKVLFGIEVTERTVDATRIRNAMNEKVMPAGLTDYLYFVTTGPSEDALAVSHTYFGQGHDVNFIAIADWVPAVLSLTYDCRAQFTRFLHAAFSDDTVPTGLKVAWNNTVANLF